MPSPRSRYLLHLFAAIGAIALFVVGAIAFIFITWSWPSNAITVLIGSTTFVVAISVTAMFIGRRKWILAVLAAAITALPVWWMLSEFLPNPERDRREYGEYLKMEIPLDAHTFSWETSNFDQFGDHDRLIRFQASPDSLRQLATRPLFGKFEWRSLPNGNYKVECGEPGGSFGEGWIKPEDQRFHLRYSTY